MARKIYTQEQLENAIHEALIKESERRYQEERLDRLGSRICDLESRLYRLENQGTNNRLDTPCECVSKH